MGFETPVPAQTPRKDEYILRAYGKRVEDQEKTLNEEARGKQEQIEKAMGGEGEKRKTEGEKIYAQVLSLALEKLRKERNGIKANLKLTGGAELSFDQKTETRMGEVEKVLSEPGFAKIMAERYETMWKVSGAVDIEVLANGLATKIKQKIPRLNQ